MRRLSDPPTTHLPGRPPATGKDVSVRDMETHPASAAPEGHATEAGGLPPPPLALTVDWALFEHHLAEADLSEQEKREFLEALWYIVVSFVDLGFGIEPVNHALKAAALESPAPKPSVPGALTDSTGHRRSIGEDDRNAQDNEEIEEERKQ